jgi:RNA polymerase sigma factor (sigma-70 family)
MSVEGDEFQERLLLQKACRQACGDSLMLIYQKYRKPICDFLHSRGVDGFAEDICQEVFCRIHEGRCGYDGSSEVKSYLFGIAKNIHIEELKEQDKLSRVYANLQVERNVVTRPVVPQSSQMHELSESCGFLAKRIADLPLKSAQAVQMVYLEGIPVKKAARIADCNIGTFRVRLCCGLQCLRKFVKNR